ncbi:MAG: hypothetical protein KAW92_06940 [Candidatus Cloacimonetes bacterium]|nr:hypothetical protein [Candidatus Cloacimonadota bacterium]
MKRRTLLKTSLLASFYLKHIFSTSEKVQAKFCESTQKSFDLLEVRGSYEQIGYQIGKVFGANIRQIIQRRSGWHSKLINILNNNKGRHFSKELLRLTQKHFPHILKEVKGMADGAGVDFNHLWVMCIKSELLAHDYNTPGCSSIFYQDNGKVWLFHNEDGHAAYDGLMFVVKVLPPSGVSFISQVYPGIITGNGPSLNIKGVIQTTNYIGSTRSEIGIPRYVIGRAILEAKNAKEAVEIAIMQPRAYPYHHHIGSMVDQSYFSIETTPDSTQVKEPKGLYFHTNHLIFKRTQNYKYEDNEYKNTSSISRYEVIEEKLKTLDLHQTKPEDLLEILSSHQNAPYSPWRHPQGDIRGMTLGTAFFDLREGIFRLYKGNPCKAVKNQLYVNLEF